MPALLALIPAKDWLWAAAFAAALIFGVHLHHKILAEGIAEQKAADDKAMAALVASTAAQTAELQAKAAMAEQAYEKEVNSLSNLPVPVVRLCVYPHPGGSVVPEAGTAHSGDASTGAASGAVQPMPAGNSSSGAGAAGPDIGAMLSALAVAADRDSAALREFQSR